jgi:predicted nuclease of predicted toxin-antitoxin system
MRFIVDAHLPFGLCTLLQAAGHETTHTRQLPDQNRTTDEVINELSIKDRMVVISKDTDFYYSHLLFQKPYKLLLVRTGNIGVRELKQIFESNLPEILRALEHNSLVELYRTKVYIVV